MDGSPCRSFTKYSELVAPYSSYTAEPVSRQAIQDLIDSAILAPSGMNLQPWAFTVVTSREVMEKMNSIVVGILRGPEVQQHMGERMKEIVNAPDYDIFYRLRR